jgi:hypothetical protein
MSRAVSDQLFQVIKSMNKNEKRYFKMITASSGDNEDKKIIVVFDEINNQTAYDEKVLLHKNPGINPKQLPNLKAYLQEKILQTLRQFNASRLPDLQIREQIDYAQLLFERHLLKQGIVCLSKAKKLAENHEKLELLLEIIRLEKNIFLENIDGENINKVDSMIREVKQINAQINNINLFSNLALKLEYFFTKIGSVRNEKDFLSIEKYFGEHLPEVREEELSINEKIHLYNLFIAYYSYIQDFELNYFYSKKLLNIFFTTPALATSRTEIYLKSMNLILIAQYRLIRYAEFAQTLEDLRIFSSRTGIQKNEHLRLRSLKYIYSHEINLFFMRGDFTIGADYMIKECNIEAFLDKVDKHSQLIFYYKIACLYFGAGNFKMALRWLNKIINDSHSQIREDLHCFARIINLISHYELENSEVINYYIISTYRFLLKKEDLHLFQKYILAFLKKLTKGIDRKALLNMFIELKLQLQPLSNSRFENRAFYYFDIISWLESKIEKIPVEEIVKRNFSTRQSISEAIHISETRV